MTGSKRSADPFDELRSLLLAAHILDEIDARIYVFGLRKGTITSGGILKEKIVHRQSTGADRLRELAHHGYFATTLDEPTMRGKGHAKKYRAIPPDESLRDFLSKYHGIQGCIEKILETRELLSEENDSEDEIWLLKPMEIALHKIADIIRDAKESVKIFGHDCSWFDHPEIKGSFSAAISKKIDVQLFASAADERMLKGFKKIGIPVHNTSATYVPFCLVDNSLLLLPCMGGTLSQEYFVLMTKQKYLVRNFAATFDSLFNQYKMLGEE